MNKYESMTWEELRELPSEEFYKIPKTYSDPTDKNEFTRKGYVDALPTTYSGYDATKTQVLKNINGTLTWVDE